MIDAFNCAETLDIRPNTSITVPFTNSQHCTTGKTPDLETTSTCRRKVLQVIEKIARDHEFIAPPSGR